MSIKLSLGNETEIIVYFTYSAERVCKIRKLRVEGGRRSRNAGVFPIVKKL
jgi:hypothetical protein